MNLHRRFFVLVSGTDRRARCRFRDLRLSAAPGDPEDPATTPLPQYDYGDPAKSFLVDLAVRHVVGHARRRVGWHRAVVLAPRRSAVAAVGAHRRGRYTPRARSTRGTRGGTSTRSRAAVSNWSCATARARSLSLRPRHRVAARARPARRHRPRDGGPAARGAGVLPRQPERPGLRRGRPDRHRRALRSAIRSVSSASPYRCASTRWWPTSVLMVRPTAM